MHAYIMDLGKQEGPQLRMYDREAKLTMLEKEFRGFIKNIRILCGKNAISKY